MDAIKLFDSELKIMEILWREGHLSAKEISVLAGREIGWNKNTTYTILKKLIDKNVIKREEPGFLCSPLLLRNAVQKDETERLIDKLWDGSKKAFFAAFVDEHLSKEEFEELKSMIERR